MSRHGPSHEDGFSHSMTDLMAGVAVTFLLLAAIFMVQADALKRAALKKKLEAERAANELRTEPEAKREMSELVKKLAEILTTRSEKVTIEPDPQDPLLLEIRFQSDDWFAPGACTPNREPQQKVEETLAEVFASVCDPAYRNIESIVLEGHSDRTPLYPGVNGSERCGAVDHYNGGGADDMGGFRNNVRLSAARAQEVFFLAQNAVSRRADSAEKLACIEKKFVVSGRGPVAPRDGTNWRMPPRAGSLNADRRVVLKVRFHQRDAGATNVGPTP